MDAKYDDNLSGARRISKQTINYEKKPQPILINTEEDEDSIFDLCIGSKEKKQSARNKLDAGALKAYSFLQKNIPGFFTPYNSKTEFGIVASAPIVAPIAFAIASAAAAATAAGAALTALGSLVFAAGSGLYSLHQPEAQETTNEALMVAAKASILAAACTAITIAAAILTAVLAPVALVYFLTRSGASIVNEASKCISSCSSEAKEDHYEDSYKIASIN
ncbi:hypothetical protein [Legionella sp. WA2022007384]